MAPNDVLGLMAVAAASAAILRGPIGKAIARWIESWGATEQAHLDAQAGAGPVAIHELERRIAELEAREARLAELEERVDFTERLLAREAPARQLPEAGG
jgi:hypothetical protein